LTTSSDELKELVKMLQIFIC